ncbi:hypothetical protein [Actinomadura hibisca]|uniref:hypothetical protein n=1 Tax=Actinomadura hibisca TaxID=68565 RepID=UPI00082B3A13|nr:hypothetical protein [Actinomadura hibisca]
MAELGLPGHDVQMALRIRGEAIECDPERYDEVHQVLSAAYAALTDHEDLNGTYWSQVYWVRRTHMHWHRDHGTECRLGRLLREQNAA